MASCSGSCPLLLSMVVYHAVHGAVLGRRPAPGARRWEAPVRRPSSAVPGASAALPSRLQLRDRLRPRSSRQASLLTRAHLKARVTIGVRSARPRGWLESPGELLPASNVYCNAAAGTQGRLQTVCKQTTARFILHNYPPCLTRRRVDGAEVGRRSGAAPGQRRGRQREQGSRAACRRRPVARAVRRQEGRQESPAAVDRPAAALTLSDLLGCTGG